MNLLKAALARDDVLYKGVCGEYQRRIQWKPISREAGWVVQKIKISFTDYADSADVGIGGDLCIDGLPFRARPLSVTYWEAWLIVPANGGLEFTCLPAPPREGGQHCVDTWVMQYNLMVPRRDRSGLPSDEGVVAVGAYSEMIQEGWARFYPMADLESRGALDPETRWLAGFENPNNVPEEDRGFLLRVTGDLFQYPLRFSEQGRDIDDSNLQEPHPPDFWVGQDLPPTLYRKVRLRSNCCSVEPGLQGEFDSRKTNTVLCEDNHTGPGDTPEQVDGDCR